MFHTPAHKHSSSAGQVTPGLDELHALCDAQRADRGIKVVPYNVPGECATGHLSSSLTAEDISLVLGFSSNCRDDTDKVKLSWGFKVNGVAFGIWDYKGTRWSTFGPKPVLAVLFPGKVR